MKITKKLFFVPAFVALLGCCSCLSTKNLSSGTIGKETPESIFSFSNESARLRFKDKSELFESPTIVPRVSDSPRFDVNQRVDNLKEPKLSPHQQFDVAYNSREQWYNKDKKVFAVDPNYKHIESYLLKDFSNAIRKSINPNPELVHVSNHILNKAEGIHASSAPYFSKEALKTNMVYAGYSASIQAKPGDLIAVSDPFGQTNKMIMGN